MSVDKWEYLGPYLKIEIPQKSELEEQEPKCCGRVQPSGKFCAQCGKPLEVTHKVVIVDAVSQCDISEAIDEQLRDLSDMAGQGRDGFDYWSPNGTPSAWKLPKHDKVGAQEVTPEDIARTSALFAKRYKKEIAIIEKAYGAPGQIRFGLLVWFS